MPTRLVVTPPLPSEEARQLAAVLADLHYVISIIMEDAPAFLPGEAVEEARAAWLQAEPRIASAVMRLQSPGPDDALSPNLLAAAELTGPAGQAKRALMNRRFDGFMRHWNVEPQTEWRRQRAVEAAADYVEFGATVFGSIPGHEQVVEILSLVRQLLGIRARRDAATERLQKPQAPRP